MTFTHIVILLGTKTAENCADGVRPAPTLRQEKKTEVGVDSLRGWVPVRGWASVQAVSSAQTVTEPSETQAHRNALVLFRR